jgi:hypothetical protein
MFRSRDGVSRDYDSGANVNRPTTINVARSNSTTVMPILLYFRRDMEDVSAQHVHGQPDGAATVNHGAIPVAVLCKRYLQAS